MPSGGAATTDSSIPEADGNGAKKKLVRGYIDGCFDIMHSGHYNAIRQAKSVCDVLVVGVHSDIEIQENKAVPVMRQPERYGLLEHVKWIDEVLHDVPYSPELATLERARASFCVHGDDMPVNAQGVGAYDGMRDAGMLRIVKRTEGVSTTDIIGRLLTLSRHQHIADHAWKEVASPATGVKVPSEVAANLCIATSSGVAASAAQQHAVEEALAFSRGLAERYSILAEDFKQLEGKLQACLGGSGKVAAAAGPATQGSPAKKPRTEKADETSELRTRAPVQILASTRRIMEFAPARQPKAEDTIVYCCGSFDMFHVGHAEFLKEARALGSFLVVGLQDDLTVSRAKGASYPVMTLNERVLNVCSCKWVDEVIIGAPGDVTEDLIKTFNIQIVARGTQHRRNESLASSKASDRYAVPLASKTYREIPSKWPELCHDTVVKRIIEDREAYLQRNRDRARREDAYYAQKDKQAEL